MRVVGYVRVSTEKQFRDGLSLSIQEEKVRGYCQLHGHELLELIPDVGVSFKSLKQQVFSVRSRY